MPLRRNSDGEMPNTSSFIEATSKTPQRLSENSIQATNGMSLGAVAYFLLTGQPPFVRRRKLAGTQRQRRGRFTFLRRCAK